MHPTIDEQLAGARRLLDQAVTDKEVPGSALELLTNVRRLLDQVSRSWSSLPAFYRADNDEMISLMMSLQAVLATETRHRLEAFIDDPSSCCDVAAAAERNANLRAVLAQVIRDLPEMDDARSTCSDVARYLRRRVESDPS